MEAVNHVIYLKLVLISLLSRRDFQESQLKEIELKGVTSLGLRAVLDFVYTSRLALNSNHIHDILQTASHLQFNQVIEYCCQFLK